MSPRQRVPGIIGGAGPGATARLYLDIMHRCSLAGLSNRPPVLIASLDIDLAIEARLLCEGVGVEHYLDPLLVAARSLVAGGADFLAMPCNTLHVLMPELREAVSVPVLSILDTVAAKIEQLHCCNVGLLATGTTARSGLYEVSLQRHGITVKGLSDALQTALQRRILAEVAQQTDPAQDALGAAISEYFAAAGVCAIVAGCTELKAVMAGWPVATPVIDSLDVLGAAVAEAMAP